MRAAKCRRHTLIGRRLPIARTRRVFLHGRMVRWMRTALWEHELLYVQSQNTNGVF
jgi:hypothetical protein